VCRCGPRRLLAEPRTAVKQRLSSRPQQSPGRRPELRPGLRTRSPRAVCNTLHAVTLRILHPSAGLVNRIEPCASQTLNEGHEARAGREVVSGFWWLQFGLYISNADDALLALVELQKFCLGDSGVPHLIDDVRVRLGHRA